jgi:hypothetical protein
MSMINRRLWLDRMGTGTGGVALAWLLARENQARSVSGGGNTMPGPEIGLPHFVPKAKRVLHIFHPGGISHVDTFDYKPELAKQVRRSREKRWSSFSASPAGL